MPIDIEYIPGILNSRAIYFFLSSIATRLESGSFRFFTQYLEQLPIPTPTPEQARRLEGFTDDSRLNELNALVYELYGLNAEEIALVEELTAGAYGAGSETTTETED